MPTEAPDLPTTLALRAGAVIADRFRVARPLPSGSAYAITYLADDLTRGEPIVIKEFFPRGLVARAADGVQARPHSPESGRDFVRALRRFVIEGSVLSEIAHPHVVRARGLVEANGTAYLVLDQHHSQSLTDYLRANGGRLTPTLAGRIVQHLLTALEPLHAESVVHRDLSPRSVHVQGDGSVLLLEFSARRHLPLHATDLASGFAAFEQYGMRDIGPWTDVYAVSAILYYLLTGVVPPSALDRAAGEALQSPTTLAPNLSPGLTRLILRGMSLLPQQRPHVASELRRQLESSLSESVQQPGRGPQSPFAVDARMSSGDAGSPEIEARAGALKFAAGGIVVPGEERSDGLLRRLGNAATRFRRTPLASPSAAVPREERQAPEFREPERRPTPVPESRLAEVAPAAIAQPNEEPVFDAARVNASTALMPMDEGSLPVPEQGTRPLDLAMQLALAQEEIEASLGAPDHRRRYSVLAAAALVVAVAGSLAFLSRSSSASGSAIQPTAKPNEPVAAPAAAAMPTRTPVPSHEVVEAGTVVQTAARPDSAPAKPAVAPVRTRAPEPARRAAPAPASASQLVLPTGKLPNVNVAIAGPSTDLKLVSPEMLVDARTRLSNGQDAVDQGDYIVARRGFRGALQQLDSLAARYPDSEKIRGLRREIEQADARALQACGAENEMRKRRGIQGKACQ